MNVSGMATKFSAAAPAGELVPTRKSLLERLRDLENDAAWQEFFDTYWKLIYAAAIKNGLSDSEAEEVVQETVIGIARKMESFRYEPEKCSFKGWLMHVTRRRIIDHLRKRQIQAQFRPISSSNGDSTETDTVFQMPDTAAEEAFAGIWDGEWQKNLVDAAMQRVRQKTKAEHYQIFHLHSVKNMPARDIAQLLGISATKVYVVSHRVARTIRREAQKIEKGCCEREKKERKK